jgi:phosphoribosylaminoimidazole-succinocarboxamide synthase
MPASLNLHAALPHRLAGFDDPELGQLQRGKVRDAYQLEDNRRILITTDRVSAFDRVLGLIPAKGQVLNQLSAWWFAQTSDIVANHLLAVPDPNVTIARNAAPLPVEVVVRGYITGVTDTALWTRYAQGDRRPYGIPLPEGLQKNDPLPEPIITPTSKATDGGHDERLTRNEILARKLIPAGLWAEIESVAVALFKRGQELAAKGGLILVDTKYEFGLIEGELTLIDEIHTPDSSRFWLAESYTNLNEAGPSGEPENFDKEFLRQWFAQQGYRGEGDIPPMPDEFVIQVAGRYIQAYERLTGETFTLGEWPVAERIKRNLRQAFNQ